MRHIEMVDLNKGPCGASQAGRLWFRDAGDTIKHN